MSYLYSKGKRILGDIIGADDSDRDTKIDFEDDQIKLETGGSTRFKVSGSSGAITFNEAFTFPTTDGSNNQVLKTNGSGVVTWENESGGGGGSNVSENVITESASLSLASSNNRDTILITPLSSNATYTLPAPEANFKIKFVLVSNAINHNIIFRTKQSSQKIFGLLYRVSFGGDTDTGYDGDPTSYIGSAAHTFIGGASEGSKNTITLDNALQGSDIDFYSDGTYWYVRGTIVATATSHSSPATITFSNESY